MGFFDNAGDDGSIKYAGLTKTTRYHMTQTPTANCDRGLWLRGCSCKLRLPTATATDHCTFRLYVKAAHT